MLIRNELNQIINYKSIFTESLPDYYDLLNYEPTPYYNNLMLDFLRALNPEQGKAPIGQKINWEAFKNAVKFIQQWGFDENKKYDIFAATMSRMNKSDIDSLLKIVNKKTKSVTKIESKEATYYNESNISEQRFKQSSKEIEDVLSTLKGFHAKVTRNLIIKFKRKEDMKAKASYKTSLDEIWVRGDYNPKNEQEYGSVVYIIVHELGHRYLKKYRVNFNHDTVDWITTPYSKVDSMTGEEKFAELFALSHFKYKRFPQFNDKILKFENKMSNQ